MSAGRHCDAFSHAEIAAEHEITSGTMPRSCISSSSASACRQCASASHAAIAALYEMRSGMLALRLFISSSRLIARMNWPPFSHAVMAALYLRKTGVETGIGRASARLGACRRRALT